MKKCSKCADDISDFEADKNGNLCDVCFDNQDNHRELRRMGDNRDQIRERSPGIARLEPLHEVAEDEEESEPDYDYGYEQEPDEDLP